MILEFLDEHARYKLYILQILEIRKNQFLTLAKMCELLGLSKYKVQVYLEELQSELSKGEKELFAVEIMDKGELEWTAIDAEVIRYQRYLYAKQSIRFRLFHNLFMGKYTMDRFAVEESLSLAQVYNIRKELVFVLNQWDLDIEGMNIVGKNEVAVRNSIFEIYYYFFNGIEYPFEEKVFKQCSQIKDIVIYSQQMRLIYTKQIKMEIFLAVQLIRARQGHVLETSLPNLSGSKSDIQKNLEPFYNKLLFKKEKEEQIAEEIKWVLLFLIIDLEVVCLEYEVKDDQRQHIKNLSNKLLLSVKKHVQEETIHEEWVKKICNKTQLNMMRFFYFRYRATTFIEDEQRAYFRSFYPTFHKISIDFIETARCFDETLWDTEEALSKAYYDCLFTLISIIPINEVEKKINICVDFSHGEEYTKFVCKNIENFRDLNITIQEIHNQYTDIYMSDFAIKRLNCRQIIWRNPPTSSDWEEFADCVLKIKKEKFNE
ncbi:helix-turn-helix domain-containing protein [Vagococcus entomophilus]|uniref:Mga helix-turn-helix domain-containing protein n=1 Tax=Vagococcus entomophilus TaxID=1160095 RepID=A0A430AGA9_9ENTE|nr:helix-turn-helix domain-containing protein [Vagococcus entomophilus]RSU06949.1 hypothetical protein CBF30_06725 [Vagococcus entomophilus]